MKTVKLYGFLQYTRNAVKRRLRPEMCLSSYPRRLLWRCTSGPYVRGKGLVCDRWFGSTRLKREREKRENKNLECNASKSNQFRIFSILCHWHLILPPESLKRDFTLWICSIIKTVVHLKMKTSWWRKSNLYDFLCSVEHKREVLKNVHSSVLQWMWKNNPSSSFKT